MITAENARELQQRSAKSRVLNRLAQLQVLPIPAQTQQLALPTTSSSNDPLAGKLAHAIDSTLADLMDTNEPKCKAMLAQALRNLRETYHLVTGQPRPGQIKSVAPRTRAQAYPSPEVIPEPIAIEAQVSPSVPSARPNAGCGVQTPTSSVPTTAADQPTPQAQQ